MARKVVSIRGFTVKEPHYFDIETYNLTNSNRTGNGTMVIQIIAQKLKFLFKYDVISGTDIEVIKEAIMNPGHAVFELIYKENSIQKSAMVYSGALKRKLFRTDGIWYWTNVTFDLIEI